ncbi:MAG: hypothetical protein N2045_00910 [Fimbriimonadales bacterium]|nr:hypothetical protein [Fimbriimonadales bacterium]
MRWLWRLLRLLGDVRALSRGRLGQRLAWRVARGLLWRMGRRGW